MGNFFKNLLANAKSAVDNIGTTTLTNPFSSDYKQNLVSPRPQDWQQSAPQALAAEAPTPSPSPTPTPAQQYRNPKWEQWQQSQPKRFEELLAGSKEASTRHGIPLELLMDISGLETSGGQFLDQLSGGPGQGYFQFEPGQSYIPEGFDPYSATQSALLAGKRIAGGNLSNWGTPGGNWGTLDNPNNVNGKLTDFYTNEELNPYLSPNYQLR